jgi:hypothetical protein
MRRVWAAVALGLAVGLAATGCSRPAGVDGNLTNGWPAMGPAKVAVPPAGVCYDVPYTTVWTGDFSTVDCAGTHRLETAYVGAFTGDDASRSAPPGLGSPALGTAYARCQQGASDYLGGDWHNAIVWLGLVRPSENAWSAGARWFRCDLVHYNDPYETTIVERGSLKGDLTGARSAAFGCLATMQSKNTVLTASPIDCAQPHGAEFAGTFTAPDIPWPTDQAARTKLSDGGCETVVAHYLGFANSGQWNNSQIGWWDLPFDENQWALGDRTTQCFAFAFTKSGKMIGSVKGIRTQAPKS